MIVLKYQQQHMHDYHEYDHDHQIHECRKTCLQLLNFYWMPLNFLKQPAYSYSIFYLELVLDYINQNIFRLYQQFYILYRCHHMTMG